MELQLGLALSVSTNLTSVQSSWSLNSLDLINNNNINPHSNHNYPNLLNKRTSFSQLFQLGNNNKMENDDDGIVMHHHHHHHHHHHPNPTLSLLPLSPAHHDHSQQHASNLSTITKSGENDDVESGVVGWPPLNSWRKRLRCHGYDDEFDDVDDVDDVVGKSNNNNKKSKKNSSMYVKVKMEGVGIARKVDLNIHHSFHTLKDALFHMFGNQHSKCYQLAYQDQDGDWLLADDIPWRNFIQSAQRLKLVKTGR